MNSKGSENGKGVGGDKKGVEVVINGIGHAAAVTG